MLGAMVPANEGREVAGAELDPRALAVMQKFGEIVAAKMKENMPALAEQAGELMPHIEGNVATFTGKMGDRVSGAFATVGEALKAVAEEAPAVAKTVATVAVDARIGTAWRKGPLSGVSTTIEAAIGTWHMKHGINYAKKVAGGLADSYSQAKAA